MTKIFQQWELILLKVKYSTTGPPRDFIYIHTYMHVCVCAHVCVWQVGVCIIGCLLEIT